MHEKVCTESHEFGVQTGMASGARDHSRLEVVEDDFSGTTAKESQGIGNGAIELGLLLRQRELDVEQSAVAKDSNQDGNRSFGASHLNRSAIPPVHLHGLPRLVVHFLVHA